MVINYLVRIDPKLSLKSEADKVASMYSDRGFTSPTTAFQYVTSIVAYCEEQYGVRYINMTNDDCPGGIDIGVGTGLYDSIIIEIEQCHFIVGEEP